MRTSLSVREARAQLVHQAALKNPAVVETADDIRARFPTWTSEILEQAIGDNVDAGLFTEAADGRLCVRPRA